MTELQFLGGPLNGKIVDSTSIIDFFDVPILSEISVLWVNKEFLLGTDLVEFTRFRYRRVGRYMVPDNLINATSLTNSFESNKVKKSTSVVMNILHKHIPGLQSPINKVCTIEGCGSRVNHIEHLVTHLNDAHRWTFDQIADHLEILSVNLEVVK